MRHLLLLGYFNIYGLAIHFLLGRLGVTALPQLLINCSTQVQITPMLGCYRWLGGATHSLSAGTKDYRVRLNHSYARRLLMA